MLSDGVSHELFTFAVILVCLIPLMNEQDVFMQISIFYQKRLRVVVSVHLCVCMSGADICMAISSTDADDHGCNLQNMKLQR